MKCQPIFYPKSFSYWGDTTSSIGVKCQPIFLVGRVDDEKLMLTKKMLPRSFFLWRDNMFARKRHRKNEVEGWRVGVSPYIMTP